MKILVINGSPKGKHSVTLQTVNYLQILYPDHEFEILHAGQSIKALEKDFSSALAAVERAEVLLFSYPVYTFIAPSQLHRFVELLKEAGPDLSGKYASQISTSKHFYDMTAHRYIQDNCADLGLRYIKGLSADMDDLTTERGRKEAQGFFEYLCWSVDNELYEALPHPARTHESHPVHVPEAPAGEKSGDVVIVADLQEGDTQLRDMIERFRVVMPRRTRVVNIREYPFRGGCLGCFNCAVSEKCVYTDGFDEYLRKQIQTADSIVLLTAPGMKFLPAATHG